MFKRAEVVMLSTNQKSNLHKDSKNLHFLKEPISSLMMQAFHLYFLSNEEIKKNDLPCWAVNKNLDTVYQVQTLKGSENWNKIIATTAIICTGYNKETSKTFNDYQYLPQPSQSFIEHFVEQYNKGVVIDKVMIEYNDVQICESVDNYDENDLFVNGQKVFSWSHEEPPVLENKKKEFEGVKINPDNTINCSIETHGKCLEYWKSNAEEDYKTTPISVLKYISVLEESIKYSYSREEVIELLVKIVKEEPSDLGVISYWNWHREWIEQNL